ncbi:MAG: type I DNA topoisomerase [Bacteroidales bacterium]|nr:type I DNA topoisomerase [Bacteroidales bacterium]
MAKQLVIVESPAKAKTIEKFLGKDFTVKSSFGHIRDLPNGEMGVDVDKNFTPKYVRLPEKEKLIKELKKLSEDSEYVWLATDEDREGEAIAWHLAEELNIKQEKIKRIAFHEITKNAILYAIENPRSIDQNLVDAQQARRVLDRLVGFEISPILWRKVKPSLSAGRVQSVAVRLIVEREKEIKNFNSTSYYRVTAEFYFTKDNEKHKINAELSEKFEKKEDALKFLKNCINAEYTIEDIETKPLKRSPAPPFTTSTLQQEASRKLNYSVSRTMLLAQRLYESGKITYMRTDSVNLSGMALNTAKEEIKKVFGEDYIKTRQYQTKSKGAQEAHEAIRPTYISTRNLEGDAAEARLYELIWKRTIASQMSDALIDKTNVTIKISTNSQYFIAKGEIIKFDGFLKVYNESQDDEEEDTQKVKLPPITIGQKLLSEEIKATQRFTQHPPRYSEASLVKKLEELGIGRPSTYAPTISTIQKREYIVNESREGSIREYDIMILNKNGLSETKNNEKTDFEKNKLFPTDIGTIVTDFLLLYFNNILDYNFTAKVELEFDEIAEGNKIWNRMIKDFYIDFHKQVEETTEKSEKMSGSRLLGTDPQSGKNVYAKIGRFGMMIQIGENTDKEKPKFASMLKGQSLDKITLDEALELFKLPRVIGRQDDEEIVSAIGKFGPYIRFKGKFYSLPKTENPFTITLDKALELIMAKQENKTVIKEFEEDKNVIIKKGRYGPYISFGKNNYRIPKDKTPSELTLKECMDIIEKEADKPAKKTKKK